MSEKFTWKRDYYAGGLMLLLGVGAAVTGSGYKFGSLARMGPGFMPVVLGVLLAFLGLLIAGTALGSSEPDDKKFLPDNPQWFGWLCILARSRPFHHPRTLWRHDPGGVRLRLCLRARRQDRHLQIVGSSWRPASPCSACCLFHYLLNIPFPLLRGVNL